MSFIDKKIAYRKKLLELYFNANAGHIGSSLSCIDLLIGLFEIKTTNERVILSKGHAAAALYTVLSETGEIDTETLSTFYKNGTKLSAHPSANSFTNIPFALGSLGHGFPIGCGIAYANKLENNLDYSYILMSDGETNEGTTWEAAHFAIAKKLDNLIIIIDKNKLQGFGYTKDVLGDTADVVKWKAIGFEVIEQDGHDIEKLIENINNLKLNKNGIPKLIIADTIKGKGVEFMENKLEWHYLPMNTDMYKEALNSLEKNYNA
ncbi:MAG: 1-deoxy-D-xylulose-5-phosphate synthase N-terminal domain-containing protein [Bacteroidota bacterium]